MARRYKSRGFNIFLLTAALSILVATLFITTKIKDYYESQNGEEVLAESTSSASPLKDCVARKVTTFAVSGNCGENAFTNVSFTCGDGSTGGGEVNNKRQCANVVILYERAKNFCKSKCKPIKPTRSPNSPVKKTTPAL